MLGEKRIISIFNPIDNALITINPKFHYPLRARFQPIGLQAGFLLVELTARREDRLYKLEAKTHFSIFPSFQYSNLVAAHKIL
ncbi:MAG: hypothetical protein IMF00_04765 [Proteobacteria bacterium]|nr:hypothetical protein [Pseudomonadota bacterium]